MCPDNVKIPQLLFEKLTKKYYQEEWAYKYDQIANCTVLTVEQNVLREVRVHRQYLQAMKNILMMYSSTGPGKSMPVKKMPCRTILYSSKLSREKAFMDW